MKKMKPIHPGEVLLQEFLEPMGISQYRLAKDTSVPARRINEIVHGARSITADTALRLGRYFGTSAQFWLNLQTHFDLEVQQDKHQCLRLGYTSLYNATMTRFKDQCGVQERVRVLLNSFPVVTGRVDAAFTYADYTGPMIDRPAWDRGEELQARLSTIQREHDKAAREARDKHAAALRKLSLNQEETDAQKNESYSAEIVGIMAKNKALMQEVSFGRYVAVLPRFRRNKCTANCVSGCIQK